MIKIQSKKIDKPLQVALLKVKTTPLVLSDHAQIRMSQRGVFIDDIKSALLSGQYIPKYDRFNEEQGWSYFIEGYDYDDKRVIRLGIGLTNYVVVVTVIKMGRK